MPVRNRRLLTSYTHLAFTAYDWLINLDEEIHCFWDFLRGRRPTVAALLYGLNRYPPIVVLILQLQTIFPMSDKVRATVMCYCLKSTCGWLTKPSRRAFSRPAVQFSPAY